MIDVHCHILPGIDDGAKNMETSVEMARLLADNGFDTVIATPHVLGDDESRNTLEVIESKVSELKQALSSESISLEVLVGAEYYMDRSVPDLARVNYPLATLGSSKYMLIEMPMSNIPPYMDYSVLRNEEDTLELDRLIPFLRPVIAHPERNEKILEEPKRINALRDRGYFFQANLESVLGLEGRRSHKISKKMGKKGMIDLIGTDGHSTENLKRMLPGWRKKVEKVLGKDRAHLVLDINPRRLIEDKIIEWED